MTPKMVTVSSMVGARTGEAAVMLRVGDQFVNASPDEARKIGIDLISSADRAEFEARLVKVLREGGMADDGIGQVVQILRNADKGDQ